MPLKIVFLKIFSGKRLWDLLPFLLRTVPHPLSPRTHAVPAVETITRCFAGITRFEKSDFGCDVLSYVTVEFTEDGDNICYVQKIGNHFPYYTVSYRGRSHCRMFGTISN
jgi:hypothetical protein